MTPAHLSVSDRLDILDVLTRADDAASARDADAYVELFTEDAALDGAQGVHTGKETLRHAVGPIWASEGVATLHLTLNPTLDTVGANGDEVVAHSVLLIVKPGTSPQLLNVSSITQRLKRVGTSWRISHRTVKTNFP
jgi:ketosteroid isomerase-like protein